MVFFSPVVVLVRFNIASSVSYSFWFYPYIVSVSLFDW